MTKGIGIKKTTYENLKKCKSRETEQTKDTIKRLLDKYEERLLDG